MPSLKFEAPGGFLISLPLAHEITTMIKKNGYLAAMQSANLGNIPIYNENHTGDREPTAELDAYLNGLDQGRHDIIRRVIAYLNIARNDVSVKASPAANELVRQLLKRLDEWCVGKAEP